MTLEDYLLYLLVSVLTISSPGPGVVYSLVNAMNHGFAYAVPGFLGLAFGTLLISSLAVSGIGALITSHDYAFTILKYIGALYLVYLGVKLWRTESVGLDSAPHLEQMDTSVGRFKRGVFITLFNPKLMVFFIALFPQFIDPNGDFLAQFSVLSATFCGMLVLIHVVYCSFAAKISRMLTSSTGYKFINRVSAFIFFGFAAGLIVAQ